MRTCPPGGRLGGGLAPEQGTDSTVYWSLILLVAIGTLAFLALRILSRMLLSNLHLITDAEERVTMANTYLSLLRNEKGAMDAADRRMILERLFRPTVTGMVRDDAMPPSVWDAVSRFTSGERR